MSKLLFPSDIFSKSIYEVSPSDTILTIAQKTNVPPHFIIKDNNLTQEVFPGQMLVIYNRGETQILYPNDLVNMSSECKAQLMKRNQIDFLYPFIMVLKNRV